MTTPRKLALALLSKAVISAGWYSILTGLALLFVGLGLASVSGDDIAAGFVGVACLMTGLWQLERGLRWEFQRRPRASDDESYTATSVDLVTPQDSVARPSITRSRPKRQACRGLYAPCIASPAAAPTRRASGKSSPR